MKRLAFLAGLVFALAFASFGQAATFYVSPTGGGDGSTPATPTTFQAALTAAQSNGEHDTINLAAGTYNVDLLGSTFEYVPTENQALNIIGAGADSTILESSAGTRRVLFIDASGPDAGTSSITIQGITFQNGNEPGGDSGGGAYVRLTSSQVQISDCTFWSNSASDSGGGLYVRTDAGAVNVTGCTFQENGAASFGGGLFVQSNSGAVTVERNQFTSNSATTAGGGAYLLSSNPGVLFSNNLVSMNLSPAGYGAGALLNTSAGRVEATQNTVYGNIAFLDGGGLYLVSPGTGAEIIGNLLHTNFATTGSGGGVMAISSQSGIITTFNTVTGNEAGISGGGVALRGWDSDTGILVKNNIIRENTAPDGSDLRIDNDMDLDGNLAVVQLFNNNLTGFSIRNGGSLTQGSNIDLDPQFLNVPLQDFRLAAGSPCVDTGDSVGAFPTPLDLDGLPRVVDGDRNGTAVVDMGAYEAQPNVSVNPPDKDFGTLYAGEVSPPQTFTVTNAGSLNLVLGTLSLQTGSVGSFTLQNDTCSGLTLAPSETCTVQAAFSPFVPGYSATDLRIPSNDPDTPALDVPLSGLSEQGPVYPVRGTIGTEVTLTGAGFGDARGKAWLNLDGKAAKFQVISWTPTQIQVLWKKKALPHVYDLYVQPKKTDPELLGSFEIRNPAISPSEGGGEYGGPPGQEVRLFGFYFSTKKPKVTIAGNGLSKPKKCKVVEYVMHQVPLASWGESETVIRVPNVAAGTYDLTVTNKIGTHTRVGGFQVQ